MQHILYFLCILFLSYLSICFANDNYEGKVVKGNRNALYLIQQGKKRIFPDFNTYTQMGFEAKHVMKIPDNILESFPMGNPIPVIPVFRPDDRMYHSHCDDPDRLVNDLGIVPHLGNLPRFASMYSRVKKTSKLDMLLLGGSITAGGYFLEFVRSLQTQSNISVSYHNHGHGATEITYTIFCVDIEKYRPDLVLIDFAVNDYGHPKLMDTLIRKALLLPSKPVVVLVNLWVSNRCPVPRYLLHSYYYQIPIINVCPAVNLCYGKGQLPKHISDKYSTTDGVHPWGTQGVKFLGEILFAWWKKLEKLVSQDFTMDFDGKLVAHSHSFDKFLTDSGANAIVSVEELAKELPPPIYLANPIGLCTRCEALADDADGKLAPITPPKGFRVITRTKIGYGGFNPDDKNPSTIAPQKSFKRSWQADRPGAEISFRFYGSSVKIAIWQRRDGMGIMNAFIDGNKDNIVKVSGFFKGYTWAMERNNTGRSEIIPLFEGLKDDYHTLTLVVSDQPANPWVKGHLSQVFALLSASDSLDCKAK